MNNLVNITLNTDKTINSVDLVEIINNFREVEGNRAELRHDNFIAKIEKEIETLESVGISSDLNFKVANYKDKQGKERPCYKLNRDGMLQMLNSESTLVRYKTVEYINTLEQQIKNNAPKLSKEIQAIFVLDERTVKLENELGDLKDNMPLFNVECKELQNLVRKVGMKVLGGYKSPAYSNNSLRAKVYIDIQHQLKREFGVSRYEAIKRNQLDNAKKIVEIYKPPTVLIDEIQLTNNQITM